jgi:membrane protease YdiL (CAAX protease family)
MLPEKPWKAETILRLFGSVLICGLFVSLLVSSAAGSFTEPAQPHTFQSLLIIAAALGCFAGALFVLGRPWSLDQSVRNLAALLVCVYAGLALTWWAVHLRGGHAGTENSTLKIVIAVLSFQGASVVLVHRFLREQHRGWISEFGLDLGWQRAVLLGAAIAVIFLPVGWGLQSASASLLQRLELHPEEQVAVEVLRTSQAPLSRLVLGLAAIVVAPLGEELLFRGILYPAIKQWGFPRLAWWGTALLFGAIHTNLISFLPLTLLALCLIWLYERTGNLLAPITAHSLFNAMNFAALYLAQTWPQLPSKP